MEAQPPTFTLEQWAKLVDNINLGLSSMVVTSADDEEYRIPNWQDLIKSSRLCLHPSGLIAVHRDCAREESMTPPLPLLLLKCADVQSSGKKLDDALHLSVQVT